MLINLGVFQLKLVVDSVRDVLLIPVAFIAAFYGFLFAPGEPDRYFKRLMRLGRISDKFINLFNQHGPDTGTDVGPIDTKETPRVDELLAPYEQQLLDGIMKKTESKPTQD